MCHVGVGRHASGAYAECGRRGANGVFSPRGIPKTSAPLSPRLQLPGAVCLLPGNHRSSALAAGGAGGRRRVGGGSVGPRGVAEITVGVVVCEPCPPELDEVSAEALLGMRIPRSGHPPWPARVPPAPDRVGRRRWERFAGHGRSRRCVGPPGNASSPRCSRSSVKGGVLHSAGACRGRGVPRRGRGGGSTQGARHKVWDAGSRRIRVRSTVRRRRLAHQAAAR